MSASIDLQEFIKRHLKMNSVLNERHIKYSTEELKDLIKQAITLFQSEPKLPTMKPSVVIVGDIHGQYFDLLRMFSYFSTATECGALCQKYLFLGDYVDRGRRSLECVCLCVGLKLAFPKQFILLRGNHECRAINKVYGFYDELADRFNREEAEVLWSSFNEMFSYMPLAGLVGKKILCMHGGISKDLNSFEDIEKIPRPLEEPNQHNLAMDLLWADPMSDIVGFAPNTVRGVASFFGEDAVTDICKRLKLDLIVRAHQMMMSGYGFFANRKLITVFTAPRYQADAANKGAVVLISKAGKLGFKMLVPESEIDEHMVPDIEKSSSCVKSFGPGVTKEHVAAAAKRVKKPVV